MIFKFLNFIKKYIYSRICLCCKKEFENFSQYPEICFECSHYFDEINNNFCKKCGYYFSFEYNHKDCLNCSKIDFLFEFSRSIFVYNEFIKKLIIDIKYNDDLSAINFITRNFLRLIFKFDIDFDIICAVPMCKEDLRKRMYNQSAIFGLYLNKYLKEKLFIPDLILKTKKTRKLTSMTSEDRIKMNHHFVFNEEFKDIIKDKSILILDDTMTTGSTLNSCAMVLKKLNKNNKIYCLTFARTIL